MSLVRCHHLIVGLGAMASVLRGHVCNPVNMATEYRGHGTRTYKPQL